MDILSISVNEKSTKKGYKAQSGSWQHAPLPVDMSYLPCNNLPSPHPLPLPQLNPKETPFSPESKTHNIKIAANRAPTRAAAGPDARAAPPVNGDDELEPVGETGPDENRRVPDELILEGLGLTTVVVGNGGIAVE